MHTTKNPSLPLRHTDWSAHAAKEAESLPVYLKKAHASLVGELRAFRKTHPDWFYGYEAPHALDHQLRCWAIGCYRYHAVFDQHMGGDLPAHLRISFWKHAGSYTANGVPLTSKELAIPAEVMRIFLRAHPGLHCRTRNEGEIITYVISR